MSIPFKTVNYLTDKNMTTPSPVFLYRPFPVESGSEWGTSCHMGMKQGLWRGMGQKFAWQGEIKRRSRKFQKKYAYC